MRSMAAWLVQLLRLSAGWSLSPSDPVMAADLNDVYYELQCPTVCAAMLHMCINSHRFMATIQSIENQTDYVSTTAITGDLGV